MIDKPTPPQSTTVSDVYYDNCVVHWTPPKDDGGTEIKSYIVEALDVTEAASGGAGGGKWHAVAQTDTGSSREVKVNQCKLT